MKCMKTMILFSSNASEDLILEGFYFCQCLVGIKLSNVTLNVNFPHSHVYLQYIEIDKDFLLRK